MTKSNNQSFLNTINNGWINHPLQDIKLIYTYIFNCIKTRKTESELFKVFHPKTLKVCIEDALEDFATLKICGHGVCCPVKIILDVDFDTLSDHDYKKVLYKIKQINKSL